MNKIVVVCGPTASGKTSFAIDYAVKNNGVVINADSRQIFKGLPILSAQPTFDDCRTVNHLLYNYLEPDFSLSVAIWLGLIKKEIDKCDKLPIVVGGTGMYISSLLDGISEIPETSNEVRQEITDLYERIGYDEFRKIAEQIDENAVNKINKNDKQRLMRIVEVYKISGEKMSTLQNCKKTIYSKDCFEVIKIMPPKDKVYKNCELRFIEMLKNGVLDEVKNFKNTYGCSTNTIGYNDCLKYLDNEITKEELINKVAMDTRRYAKRQYTWFKNKIKYHRITHHY
jgi:tRNA dimethylallyltransferase